MIDDKRLAVLKALTTHLETEVSIANGYQHDLVGRVLRGRMLFTDHDSVPMVSLLEALNPDRFPRRAGNEDNISSPIHHEKWILLAQGWVADDKVNPTDPAYPLMADVKKAFAKLAQGPDHRNLGQHPSYLLGGLITGIEIEPGTVRPPDENSSLAYFYMRLILKFSEDTRDPYLLT